MYIIQSVVSARRGRNNKTNIFVTYAAAAAREAYHKNRHRRVRVQTISHGAYIWYALIKSVMNSNSPLFYCITLNICILQWCVCVCSLWIVPSYAAARQTQKQKTKINKLSCVCVRASKCSCELLSFTCINAAPMPQCVCAYYEIDR